MDNGTCTIVYDEQWRKMEREIFKLVKKNQKDLGACFEKLHLEVRPRYTRSMLTIVLHSLKSVGKVFNTVDENHWITSCLKEEIYNSIRELESKSKFGANLQKIHKDFFKEKYSYAMLDAVVMGLAEQGRVYSTINECHWMTYTENEVYI